MPARDLPARPNLEQYKKQAKDLLDGVPETNDNTVMRILLESGRLNADSLATLPDAQGRSAIAAAARRGRGAVLPLLQHGRTPALAGVDRFIAACALDDSETIRALLAEEPALRSEVVRQGGTLLAEFAGVGNTAGVRNLLDCGVSPADSMRAIRTSASRATARRSTWPPGAAGRPSSRN